MFLNQNSFIWQKILYVSRFVYSTSNKNIIKPIFKNQNKAIQIINPQHKTLKINDDFNNINNAFNFNMWAHNPQTLNKPKKPHAKIEMHVIVTKLKGF